MGDRIDYASSDGIGWIDLDDGKVNVMSSAMQSELTVALDHAEREGVVTVIRGRPGVFCAGFDLGVIQAGGRASAEMVLGGFELAHRVLAHPRPVVIACTGHAVAMGAFLLLSGDYRIGTVAAAKFTANEVAIGLTMPRAATEILRHRLTPSAFQRATLLAESFGPTNAVETGFLDEVVDVDRFDERVRSVAEALVGLDVDAQVATKRRTREPQLRALAAAIAADREELHGRLEKSASAGD